MSKHDVQVRPSTTTSANPSTRTQSSSSPHWPSATTSTPNRLEYVENSCGEYGATAPCNSKPADNS